MLILVVALRKESVDRNPKRSKIMKNRRKSLSARRAWIEIPAGCWRDARRASLSARRAWIEMRDSRRGKCECCRVALRKESVDRNQAKNIKKNKKTLSLSARRAWIEMEAPPGSYLDTLSLSARRAWIEICSGSVSPGCATCRSPQGERG